MRPPSSPPWWLHIPRDVTQHCNLLRCMPGFPRVSSPLPKHTRGRGSVHSRRALHRLPGPHLSSCFRLRVPVNMTNPRRDRRGSNSPQASERESAADGAAAFEEEEEKEGGFTRTHARVDTPFIGVHFARERRYALPNTPSCESVTSSNLHVGGCQRP